ncbi:zinc finger protein 718-like [Musca vetustissima]|uniref:zinc finger protein 718-like n=1 Tax=Musca vetustissima TaxID=27455 RepID=UPI002AB6B800|nr:zinc finger protein 718-like [Musca vetustissima]
MYDKTLCRLCVSSRSEYKSLYDDNGQGNEVYEITLKYFDPILLSPANEQDSKVICMECWCHISEFYGFQQSVLQAQAILQAQLENDVKEHLPEVKLEEELLQDRDEAAPIVDNGNDSLKDEKNNVVTDEFENEYDDCGFGDDNPFSSDEDEKPLIEHINRINKRKNMANKLNEENTEIYDTERVAGKRQRKPRGPNKKQKDTTTSTTTNGTKTNRKGRPRKLQHLDNLEEKPEPLDPDASANEMEDETFDDGSNGDKKSVKDKTKECDEFIAQWKQELECVCCPATVSNFTLLRKHFRQMHPTEKCYVICCQRKFYHRFHIVEHIRLHIDPNAFRCDECGRCSTNSRNLAKHKREMHTEEGKQRPFECDVCHKKFANKTILRTHMEVHEAGRDYVCSECGKGFPSENRRKIHERMVHQADRVCDQCGKTIHGIYALKLHLMEHAGYKKPKWPCDECNAQLNSHSSLKRHKLIAHHDGSTVYICSECGKVFTSENALRSHKRIVHLIERKFKCNICEKAFKFPKILREHMASHTGEDLYQCPHCPKTFKVSANMHHHRKKVHPKEWAEARINKPVTKKVDIALVSNEIIM